jgi:hypothetical protein
MSRVFFPTYSMNRFGVRETDQRATLGAVVRFDNEPNVRTANNPTGPMLGAVSDMLLYRGLPFPGPPAVWRGPIVRGPFQSPPAPIDANPTPPLPPGPPITSLPLRISSSGGGAPPPVSSQVGPTPTVTLPPPAPATPLLISSGGGAQSVSTPTVVAPASAGLVDGIAAWLSGSTMLFNYNVPNALLAGVVVLGFAWLSSSSGKKK